MSYIHHLFRCDEILGLELASIHNLTFYVWLMQKIRNKIQNSSFPDWYQKMAETVDTRI